MNAARIAAIRCFTVRLPFDHGASAPRFAGTPRTTLDSVWMCVELDDGLLGWGEAYAPDPEALGSIVRSRVTPLALGQDPEDEQLCARLERVLHNAGRSGPVLHALSGLDIALWDLRGKRAGLPVSELLGGRRREQVSAYASLLQYYGDVGPLERQLHAALEAGFTQVKLHERDAASVEATRRAIGDGVPMMVDTNCAWLPAEAEAPVRAMKAFSPLWIEEPLWPPEDLASLGALGRATGVAMAAGENAASLHELLQMAHGGSADWLQPSAIKCGGLSALRRVAAECAAHGRVRLSPQTAFFGPGFLATLHLMATLPEPTAIERLFCGLATVPYAQAVPLEQGTFTLPRGPGLGAEPDASLLNAPL